MSQNDDKHRVLITGGAGFIGSHLVRELISRAKYEVIVFDNESLGERSSLPLEKIEFIKGDILEPSEVCSVVEGVQTIVHLAADTRVMDSIENPSHNFRTNAEGTFNLLMAAREAGVNRFVNASTGGAILGEKKPPINETMMPEPTSPYGASKMASEGYCSAFAGAYGLNSVSLRFSNIYGPGSWHKGSVVAHFIKSILNSETLTVFGDGSQMRDYLFVHDLVRGIAKFIEQDINGVYQLGTGVPTSINQLLEILKTVLGERYPFNVEYEDFRDGEITHTWCDISKAQRAVGFDPRTTLYDGIEQTCSWFLDQKST